MMRRLRRFLRCCGLSECRWGALSGQSSHKAWAAADAKCASFGCV